MKKNKINNNLIKVKINKKRPKISHLSIEFSSEKSVTNSCEYSKC